MEQALREKLNEQHYRIFKRKRLQIRLLEGWWMFAAAILLLYTSLPIAAPVLMKAGATGPANTIYSVYGFMCHQFAFRSVFLFGEQSFYPRESVGTDLQHFEERAAQSETFVALYIERRNQETGLESSAFDPAELYVWNPELQMSSRSFKGDEQMGYKIALCQRDIAIYAAMVVGAIGYGFVRKRLRPIPLWLYLMIGIAPIALDGFSQLMGYPPFEFWEPRETTPYFRILTGALFGFMNVWLAFPYINASMKENANRIRYMLSEIEKQVSRL